MRWRAKWSHVTIALAMIAAAALVTPAIGEQSGTAAVSRKTLKKLINKEVAKQIAKATGPQGPAGPRGDPGSEGPSGVISSASLLGGQGIPDPDGTVRFLALPVTVTVPTGANVLVSSDRA